VQLSPKSYLIFNDIRNYANEYFASPDKEYQQMFSQLIGKQRGKPRYVAWVLGI